MDEWKENSQTEAKVRVAKKCIQETIKAKTGLTVDKPDPVGAGGTTTTGNMARQLLFDPVKRKVLVDSVPVKIRADGKCDRRCLMNLSQIILLYYAQSLPEERSM